MSEVTRILSAIDQGDPQAASQLLPLVYDELRRLANQKLLHEQPGQTLDATALVHEAYLRIVNEEGVKHWNSRGHFYAAAAQAMRRILVEAARRKKRHKRGGRLRRTKLTDASAPSLDERLLALHEALLQLAKEDAEAAQVIELHQFAGLNHDDVAAALGTTVYRVRQKWTYARAWLSDALENP